MTPSVLPLSGIRRNPGEQVVRPRPRAAQSPPNLTVRGTLVCVSWRESDRVDLVGLRTLWTLGGLELHPLTLVECPETRRLDCAVMDENVRTAAVHGDEA